MNIVGQYDEVHCFGGGSLLLFLLACAGKSPRLCPGGKVVLHGPLIYPTPDSCKQWLVKENKKLLEDVGKMGGSKGKAGKAGKSPQRTKGLSIQTKKVTKNSKVAVKMKTIEDQNEGVGESLKQKETEL